MSSEEQQQSQLFPNVPLLDETGRVRLYEVFRFFHENLLRYPMDVLGVARVSMTVGFVTVVVPKDGYIPTTEALNDQAIRQHISDTNTLAQLLTARTCFIFSSSSSLIKFARHIRRIRPRSVYIETLVFDRDDFGVAERMIAWGKTVGPHGHYEGAVSHLANWRTGLRQLATYCRLNVRFVLMVPYRDYISLREQTEVLRMLTVDYLAVLTCRDKWQWIPYPDLNLSLATTAITASSANYQHSITVQQYREMWLHGTRVHSGFWRLVKEERQQT